MVQDAERHAAEDKKHREEIELRNNADQLAYATEQLLHEHGDKVDSSSRAALENSLNTLRDALKRNDIQAIRNASEAVKSGTHKLSEALYRKAQTPEQPYAQQSAHVSPGYTDEPGRTNDDANTMDAEFTVVNNK